LGIDRAQATRRRHKAQIAPPPPGSEHCYKGAVLDELPSLELAATAVALALALRVVVLARREGGVMRGRARVESARARDLVGLAVLAGAIVYAIRVERASTWFLIAVSVAVVAQLIGFYLRAAARKRSSAADGGASESERDEDGEPDDGTCPVCGHAQVIELDTARLLGGLSQLTSVNAVICPSCGALSGEVEDVTKIPIGPEHGTALRKARGSEDQEALEEPAEHDG
jgi:hypothetical protein